MMEDIIYGDVFIFDGKNVPLTWILKVTPMVLYEAMVVIYKVQYKTPHSLCRIFVLQQVFSNRLKAVYLINAPYYVEKLVDFLKSVLKPKLITHELEIFGIFEVSKSKIVTFRYTFAKIRMI